MSHLPNAIKLPQLLREIRACAHCERDLPSGPRPLMQAAPDASLMIIGQAPGRRAHDSGVPWDDASGKRLREWLGLSEQDFYDPDAVALMPMGFCYPGTGSAGDLAPRPECAPRWHDAVLDRLPMIQLTVLIGKYAIDAYIGPHYRTLTEAVHDFDRLMPKRIALPHPSPRNNRWLAKNPWFEDQVLPRLKRRVRRVLGPRG